MLTFAIQMNELSRHIEILLLDNDCVIVPGFGGFMAHHKPAEYVAEEGMFYPPQRTLGFNPQLKLNDSLLVQSYVEAYDISYPEAVKRIDEEVEEIKQRLSIEGKYEFHGIGIITLKADEHLEFEPCSAGLLTPALYALNSYAFDLLSKENIAPATIQVPVTPVKAEEQKETELVVDEEEFAFDEEEHTIHISINVLRNIVAAAMILLLFVFTSIPAGRGSSNVSMCSVIDTELISSLVKINTAEISQLSQHQDNAMVDSISDVNAISEQMEDNKTENELAEEVIAEKKNETENNQENKERFVIVLASKVSKAGAEEFIKNLKHNGLKEADIYEKGSMRKVVYGNYSNEEDAQNALRTLRNSSDNFSEAWVSKI